MGDIAPTANRTITVGGGTVVTAAVTDTIDIGPDGATTNATSVKTVNVNNGGVTTGQVITNIGAGAITSGTHTVNIQSGNAAAGTVATNVSTGTGTKTVNVGGGANTTVNVDATTLINDSVNANVSINTGTSTGAVTIGNAAAGNIALDTAGTLTLDADGVLELNSSAGAIGIGNDADAQAINIGTGAAARAIAIGNTTGATDISLDAGTGGIDINAGGIVSMTPATASVAGVATTLDARVGKVTFTSPKLLQPLPTLILTLPVAMQQLAKTIFVTMSYSGAADCDITLKWCKIWRLQVILFFIVRITVQHKETEI